MTKQKLLKGLIACSLTVGVSISTFAADVDYRKAMNAQIMPQVGLSSINNNREMVQFSRAVKADHLSRAVSSVAKVESQQYLMKVTGEQLNKGLSIDTTGAGALVRISPVSGSRALQLEEFNIITPAGKQLVATDAMGLKANSQDLQDTPFSKGTSVFTFDKALGSGRFQMKASSSLANDQQFVVSVLEKDSPYKLTLQTGARQMFAGENFSANVSLSAKAQLSKVSGMFRSPDGREFSAKFAASKNGQYNASMVMNLPMTAAQGLWELRVTSEGQSGKLTVKRDARIAFAYNPVTAFVQRSSTPKVRRTNVESNIAVDTQYAGRYEVMGVLYASVKGRQIPVIEARTAMWLEVGENRIPLSFEKAAKQLRAMGADSIQVKNIVLTDQSRMSVMPQSDSMSTRVARLPRQKAEVKRVDLR